MTNEIHVGAIGCGQFMSRQHIQTINRTDGLRLCHLADSNPETLDTIAERYHPDRTSANWRDVVSDPSIDVIVVGIVPDLHPSIAMEALRAGKAVYVEKPLTESAEEGRRISALSRETGRPVAVGFNRRFAPAIEQIYNACTKTSGPISMCYRISDDSRIRPPSQKWKNQDRLLIECVHIFDVFCHLTANEPVRIFAVESRPNDALVTMEFSDGSIGTIHSSSWGSLAQPKESLEVILDRSVLEMVDYCEVRAYGDMAIPERTCFAGREYDGCDNSHVKAFEKEGASAMIDLRRRYYSAMMDSGVLEDNGNEASWTRANELLGDPPIPQINYSPDKGWGRAFTEFCQKAMSGEKPRNADAVDGTRASTCAALARKSINTGQPVELSPDMWQ